MFLTISPKDDGIPFDMTPEDNELVERCREALAKKKYAEMCADATFPPGTVVREIV